MRGGEGGEEKWKDIKKLPVGPLEGEIKMSALNYNKLQSKRQKRQQFLVGRRDVDTN